MKKQLSYNNDENNLYQVRSCRYHPTIKHLLIPYISRLSLGPRWNNNALKVRNLCLTKCHTARESSMFLNRLSRLRSGEVLMLLRQDPSHMAFRWSLIKDPSKPLTTASWLTIVRSNSHGSWSWRGDPFGNTIRNPSCRIFA
jgi:hypothetical protein